MFSFKNIESFNLWVIKIIIFAIPFLALYISPSMPFPFITGKNFAFRILVELAAVLWIGLPAVKKEYRICNSPIVLSILTFTFIVGLADLSGVNPYKSFWSNFERMEGYITILHLALYFMILKSILKTRKDWKILFTIILLVSVCVSLYPFVYTFNKNTPTFKRFIVEYGMREFSTMGNPPFLASYLLISSFIGLILFFHTRKRYLRVGCLGAVILNCAVIYLTATRGVILSVAAGLLIFISVYIFGRSNKSKLVIIKRSMLLLLVISIILTGGFFIFSNTEMIKQDRTLSRFASMVSSDSAKDRIDIWGKSWNGIKERPVLGWGQENFVGIYSVNPIAFKESQRWMDRAHNIVIEWLINAGILGLLSYLAIFGAAFHVLRKADREKALSRNESVMILTVLAVYFLQNLFTFDTINTYMIFFALLAYIDNLSIDEKPACSGPEQSMDSKKLKIISVGATLAALVCFSIVFYYVNYKPIKQARQMIRIRFSPPKNDSYSMFLRDFNNVQSISAIGDFDVKNSMLAVSNQILSRRYFDQEGALKLIQATVDELRKEIKVRSYDLEYMTDVINFFIEISVYEKSFIALSEALIEKSMRINPEYEWLYMVMADLRIRNKDYEGAFNVINRIAGLYPENENIQFKLALTAIYSSREETAKSALENIKKIRVSKYKKVMSKRKSFLALNEHYQLAKVYWDVKRYDIALQHLKKLINSVSGEKMFFAQDDEYYYHSKRQKKKMAKIHIKMAEMYLKLNDRSNALKEAEKAGKIAPVFSDNIKKLIESINN